MKRFIIVVVVLGLATSAAFAFRIAWSLTKRPPISLPAACAQASLALGTATNEFYCVGATTLISRSQDGEWLLTYSSTNGVIRHVFVFMDGKTKPQIVDGPLSF